MQTHNIRVGYKLPVLFAKQFVFLTLKFYCWIRTYAECSWNPLLSVELCPSKAYAKVLFWYLCMWPYLGNESLKICGVIIVGPNPKGWCPYKKRKFGYEETQRECRVKVGAEVGVMHLWAKAHQGWLVTIS